jgi:hypothetical protein
MAAVAAVLPKMHYRSAFEASAAIGDLTEVLALRCDRLLWNDLTSSSGWSPGPQARGRSERGTIPNQWPSGEFDLVVLNEVTCRLDNNDLDCLIDCVAQSTHRGAHVLDVRARRLSEDPLGPDHGTLRLAESQRFVARAYHSDEEFVLDLWERW